MAFKYKKIEVRSGEVVEPTRIKKNMQTLAHEVNGLLDRDNLPEKGIDTETIVADSFNLVKTQSAGSGTVISTEGRSPEFFKVITENFEVPVDCVVMAHWGCWWEWTGDNFQNVQRLASPSSGSTAPPASSTPSTLQSGFELGGFEHENYYHSQEIFADFRLLINEEEVCQTFSYPFVRQKQGGYMMGSLQVSAGQVRVSVEAKLLRDNLGQIESSEHMYFTIKDRNLITIAKKR